MQEATFQILREMQNKLNIYNMNYVVKKQQDWYEHILRSGENLLSEILLCNIRL